MISRDSARRIAADSIREGVRTPHGMTLVILDDETIERGFGWVFFYQSREYLETGDLSQQLAGNAPIIVDREDGSVHTTGTAEPVEHYLAAYEKRRFTPPRR